MEPQNFQESSFTTWTEKTARNSKAEALLLDMKNYLKLEKSSQIMVIMKPSFLQQTFGRPLPQER